MNTSPAEYEARKYEVRRAFPTMLRALSKARDDEDFDRSERVFCDLYEAVEDRFAWATEVSLVDLSDLFDEIMEDV